MTGPAAAKLSWLSRTVLLGTSLVCAAVLALVAARNRAQLFAPAWFQVAVFLVVGAAALAYVAVRKSPNARWLVAVEIVMVVVTLLAVETLIAVFEPQTPSQQMTRARVAAKLGIPFDLRTKSEVVADLRAAGTEALPGISLGWPRQTFVRQQLPEGLYPLSHASRAPIVECNESGRYLVWESDELGFNNPAGLVTGGKVAIAAVGASFTLGHCVPREASLIGQLRNRYGSVANFGLAGGGALTMLAAFREYVEPLRPPLVLWIMHPRTAATEGEMADPVLSRYLEKGFTQHLWQRQAEIDALWRELSIPMQYEFDRRSMLSIDAAASQRFKGIPLLSQLRDRVSLGGGAGAPEPIDLDPFIRSVHLAQASTKSWGGDFVVVIMPLYEEIVAHQLPPQLHHEHLAAMLHEAGVPTIDAATFFARQPDVAHLYTMRINNHPNPQGFAELSAFVVTELEKSLPARLSALRMPAQSKE
ncbi:MAG TPA: hypothetical protein VJQ52_16435 [Steroidobacteraceae bacterium]|nr:hypothetical protein [Steroidobacteraceae bacterium]